LLQAGANLVAALKYEVHQDRAGEWRWRLIASNSKKIADSGEGYKKKSDCLNAINLVKLSLGAPVVELAQLRPYRWASEVQSGARRDDTQREARAGRARAVQLGTRRER
jgi:uncharacterized protein YegP (UPF0339 family)